jgi:hypothetical protein
VTFDFWEREVDPIPGEIGLQPIYEPMLVVRVAGPLGGWLIPGLLDTGSAETLIPAEYLARLGIAKGPRFTLSGAGGRFYAWLGTVDLELRRAKTVRQWSTRVGFDPRRTIAIWGRVGFLNHFTATFDCAKRSVRLRPNETFPPPIYEK